MTRENNPVDQPDVPSGQYEPSDTISSADQPVYSTDQIQRDSSHGELVQHEESQHPAPQNPAPQQETPLHNEQHQTQKQKVKVKSSFAGSTWAALIVGALLLIVLIVFILQNQQEVEITFLQWTVHFPAAIAYLLSAITGALIMALVGGWRILELRRQVKKAGR